jgi:hypothetical protein
VPGTEFWGASCRFGRIVGKQEVGSGDDWFFVQLPDCASSSVRDPQGASRAQRAVTVRVGTGGQIGNTGDEWPLITGITGHQACADQGASCVDLHSGTELDR